MPNGNAPGSSVGHTCTFTHSEDGGKGKILIVGGADPCGSFSHCHVINLGRNDHKDNSFHKAFFKAE